MDKYIKADIDDLMKRAEPDKKKVEKVLQEAFEELNKGLDEARRLALDVVKQIDKIKKYSN